MSSNQDVIVEVPLSLIQKARQALETCRVRSLSEWEVTEITPRHVLDVIKDLDGILSRAYPEKIETILQILPKIESNDQLIVGQWYWCKIKGNPFSEPRPHQVGEESGYKYVNMGHRMWFGHRMWCDPKNDQFLHSYEAWGPIQIPKVN